MSDVMVARARLLPAHGRWPADVDVWDIDLAGQPETQRHLDAAERARTARYLHLRDRVRFAGTRSVLRELLGAYLNESPSALRFAVSGNGRPELAAGFGALSFNVSHAGERALAVVSRKRIVGIDIETRDPGLDWQPLTRLVCTAAEHAVLAAYDVDARRDAFLRCWTAKEAILKALGLGIAEGLLAVDTLSALARPRRPRVLDRGRFEAARRLAFDWIEDLAGYVACVSFAAEAADRSLTPTALPSA
ncbi:4'-phosphopantetheinyl transferase family protein [Chitinasiproducens palmae]|uniref:4'-phosphopantetheinyl transferase n=1 Tax=Chitinasiproducens palmae TaxID=1770053 RepID=A0A1H2PID2_9BURK|nr:4'-phosphopantetheinyl transferase superfamily protein [Chitinasiproducens palmae]SDV46041.1 4'-phosphopantetheinyl transferase [Chitinasiproducens palmae]